MEKKSTGDKGPTPSPAPTVMMMAPGVAPPADGTNPADLPSHMAIPMPAPSAVGAKVAYPSQDPTAMGAISKEVKE